MTVQLTRYCQLCNIEEKCHCPRMKSFCDVCCPPPTRRRIAFDFRVELNKDAPPTVDPGAAWLRAVG